MRLEGKVALVTGASQGIGAAYARALALEGAAVLLSDVADAGPVAEAIVGVVQSRVTAGAELTLPGRVTAPCRFQAGWAYGSVCWRSSEAARG